MTTSPIITYGFNTYFGDYTTYGTGFLVTGGFSGRGAAIFERVISALEKKNVAVSWIESEYIEDGLADETILDNIVASAEKKTITISWIDSRYIKAGLADHTIMDTIIGRAES